MCEFTGLDFEMEIKQHYHEVLAILSDLFVFVFDQLNAHCQKELQAVQAQYPFKPLRYNRQTLILPFSNAVKMLQDAGEDIGPEDDFSYTTQHSTHAHAHAPHARMQQQQQQQHHLHPHLLTPPLPLPPLFLCVCAALLKRSAWVVW